MQKTKKKTKFNNGWCFAIVNNRLAEIHFNKKLGIWAHCYVNRNEFSKREKKMINEDMKKCVFSYRKGFYNNKLK